MTSVFCEKILTWSQSEIFGSGKIALALVNIARRLRPYFLNHMIIVRTYHPLSYILGKADTSR